MAGVDADGDGCGQEHRAVAQPAAGVDAQLFQRFPSGRDGRMLVDFDVATGRKPEPGVQVVAE